MFVHCVSFSAHKEESIERSTATKQMSQKCFYLEETFPIMIEFGKETYYVLL